MQKMSEEIALYCLKADSESYSEACEECSIYGNVGCDHCYNDAINMAIQALEEIQQYRVIGTVDQCREAVERMKPKKPIEQAKAKDGETYVGMVGRCPACGSMVDWTNLCCDECFQRLDWSE